MLQAMREGFGRGMAIVILGLIAVAFIFFGIDFSITGTTFAAKVNGQNIPILDFERQVQAQQSQYQQVYRIELSDDLRREIRRNVVETMIRNEALEQRVEKMGYRASDARVSDSIRSTAAFQAGGEFFMDLYLSRLGTEGITPTGYEAQERVRLELTDLQSGIVDSTFLTPAEFRDYIELSNQGRHIGYVEFAVDSFLEDVTITDEDVESHYASSGAFYMTPETVDLEYVELRQEDIAANIEVSEDELKEYYEQERGQFETEEVRRARHILLNVGDDGPDAAIERANEILARLQAGEDFATLAEELSEDSGTSSQGGDLGRITRGMLPGAFEDALFDMEVGEVRGPVVSDFGVHIIKLDEISAGDVQPYESVRDELLEQLRNTRAEDLFYDTANELADKAFYADNDLATVAEEMGLPLVSLDEFPRTGDSDVFENSAPIVQAAFSAEVLDQGHNSDLIELAPDDVVVLRVTGHHVPTQQPLEAVRDQIVEELRQNGATELAVAASEAFLSGAPTADDLAALAQMHGGEWVSDVTVQRTSADLPTALLSRIFALDRPLGESPVWDSVSTSTGDQYVVALYAVEPGNPESISREERDARQAQLANQAGLIDLAAYAGEVRAEASVRIPEEVLEPTF